MSTEVSYSGVRLALKHIGNWSAISHTVPSATDIINSAAFF